MTATDTQPLARRIAQGLRARVLDVRASPLLSPAALRETVVARAGGHPVSADSRPHLEAAVAWLERAQDATPDDGIARGYALAWNPYFGAAGWQASYPETTGYIIPTLLSAARVLERSGLAARALRAARWETGVQMESGAVQGGVIGEARSPAVFNTGQVILGWLAAWEETGDGSFAASARRAGEWLVSVEDDGSWRRGNSRFARGDATAYNTRAAWGLAEAGRALGDTAMTDAAARVLRRVVGAQRPDGWFPDCCLYDPANPLLHTLAYTVRGLLEGGRVLEDERLVASATRAAEALAERVRGDGWMAGRFGLGWLPAARWSCLTGEAQTANCWLRLHEITGDARWLAPVPRVLRFLKGSQNRTAPEAGVRGGIAGSSPVGGDYGRCEILSWATKFFADALMRHDAAMAGAPSPVSRLA